VFQIIQSEFVTSVFDLSKAPNEQLPEIAFVGRSNVGKSSLLNSFCSRKSLAEVGKRPGLTQAFNYFKVTYRSEAEIRKYAYLVDLPGFGFAKVAKPIQQKWRRMIEGYLLERASLSAVLLLVDCRRAPGEEEKWISSIGQGGNLFVCMTKADKISRSDLAKAKETLIGRLSISEERLISVSTLKGHTDDVPSLRNRVLLALQ
jgi:GTP-binding protein